MNLEFWEKNCYEFMITCEASWVEGFDTLSEIYWCVAKKNPPMSILHAENVKIYLLINMFSL